MKIVGKIFLGILCVVLIISSFQVMSETNNNIGSVMGMVLTVGIGCFGLYKLFLAPSKKDKKA